MARRIAAILILTVLLAMPVIGSTAYIPLILKSGAPSPPPTVTPTPTGTSTPTGTPTRTHTPMPSATPEPTPSTNDLSIKWLKYWGTDEYVEIRNAGPERQDMTGWWIHSVVGDQVYYFPHEYVLDVGGTVRVHSGRDAIDNPPHDLKWTGAYVWNNDGDEARLYDSTGRLIDSRWY